MDRLTWLNCAIEKLKHEKNNFLKEALAQETIFFIRHLKKNAKIAKDSHPQHLSFLHYIFHDFFDGAFKTEVISTIILHDLIPLNILDVNGETILHTLVSQKIIDLNIKNSYGNTLLHTAALHHDIKTARMLIKSNKDLLIQQNSDGQTALYLAVQEKFPELFALLVPDNNAKYIPNKALQTPLEQGLKSISCDPSELPALKRIEELLKKRKITQPKTSVPKKHKLETPMLPQQPSAPAVCSFTEQRVIKR